jgi:hypothetical protein
MSLRSVDISKVRRLSLRDVKLPATEVRVDTPTLRIDRPPTDEEITYSKLIKSNPLIEKLVDRLNLVSNNTGEKIRKVDIPAQDINKPQLIALAQRLIERDKSYTKEEVIERIREATKVTQDRAEKGFNLILQAGGIELTQGEKYYLTESNPF